MLNNPIFINVLLKERQQSLIEEAEIRQRIKFAKKNDEQKKFFDVEAIANLLINLGEHLKRKYCSKPTIAVNP